MLLSSQNDRQGLGRERNFLGLGLLVAAAAVIALLWQVDPQVTPSTPERIACDAERSRGDFFYNGDFKFEGAQFRSAAAAHSGRYSLAFPVGSEVQYGFNIVLDQVRPGEVYEVSVWSHGNEQATAKLAVQGRKPAGLYFETAQIETVDAAGWALHRLRFHIPFQTPPSQLGVYVYANGSQPVYFDDLMIKKVDRWDAEKFKPTQLRIELDQKALRQLEDKRAAALRNGVLQTSEDDWVDGQVQAPEGSTMAAKVRLKGDWLDHLRSNKWSFRIKLKGAHSWRGMQTFSLHTPAARYFLHEWLLHRFWEQEDVLTTRYDFIELLINGESRGIYAYEEHFEKQLVESQQRREGPIVKFSEEGFWAGMSRQLTSYGFIRPGSGHSGQNLANAPVVAFNETEIRQDTIQSRLYQQAHLLLEAYRQGNSTPEQVFDLEKLARYYAGCDLLNGYHGIVWHNQRFYYNPLIGQLEPIGFDGFADRPTNRYHFLAEGALHPDQLDGISLPAFLLQDTTFVRIYLATLERLTRPEAWAAFFAANEEEWTARLNWLQMEFPDYQPDAQTLASEVAFVRSHLLPFAETSLRTYRQPGGGILVNNTHTLPLVIKGYSSSPNYLGRLLDTAIWLPAAPVRKLWTKLRQETGPSQFRGLDFWNEQALAEQTTPYFTAIQLPAAARYLYFQIPGWDTLLVSAINDLAPPTGVPAAQPFRQASQAKDFPSLRWNEARKIIFVPAGEHLFTRDLIVGKNHELHLAPGAIIQLNKGSAIISYGAVRAIGAEELPIEITTTDGTGQGLQVFNAATASVLKRVVVRGLTNLHKGDWALTGAVTFLASAVQIEECLFINNHSEDALNMIRSTFSLINCVFRQISSDAFDSDFCKGTLTNCFFTEVVNDGMDFSGSVITVVDAHTKGCGDKGISAGEASDITVLGAVIEQSPIGIASKDESTVNARNIQLTDCGQGLVVFQKKPEYGPAFLLVEGLQLKNVTRLYQIGPGSRLQIDDVLHEN